MKKHTRKTAKKAKHGLARHSERAEGARFARLEHGLAACKKDIKAIHQGVVGLGHSVGKDIAGPMAAYRRTLGAVAQAYGASALAAPSRKVSAHRRPAKHAKRATLVARYNPRTGRYEVPASAHPVTPRGGCGRREHATQEYRARLGVAHPGEFIAGPCMIDRSGKLKKRVRDRHGRLR